MENNKVSVIKKIADDIDYEKQDFESLGINSYEIVVAASKTAREVNIKALKFLGPEYEIRPANVALIKMSKDDVKFVYDKEKPDKGNADKM